LEGMLSGLTSLLVSKKENDLGSMRSGKSQLSGAGVEIFGLGIPLVPVRGQGVCQMTK
jgi:hypothetical protein